MSSSLLPVIYFLAVAVTEVNPESKPKLVKVVDGTNEWSLTLFFPNLSSYIDTSISVGVKIQHSDGRWTFEVGARKEPSKSHWIGPYMNGSQCEITPNGHFKIHSVTSADNGSVYRFNIVGLDADNEPVLMKLLYSPPELKEPLITEKSPTPVIITENETITLYCKSSGNPSPNIFWTKDGNDSVLHEGSNYTLKNITREQAGIYLCIAQNGIGRNASASIPVTVNYPPSIEIGPNDQTALEGSAIFFQCIASGSPIPNITWFKLGDNQTVPHEGGILLLPNVQIEATGVYICIAQNGMGKAVRATGTLAVKSYEISKWIAIFIGVLVGFALATITAGIVFVLYKKRHHFCSQKKSYTVTQDDDCDLERENLEMKKCGPGQNAKDGGPSGVQEDQMTIDTLMDPYSIDVL
ncbi:cell adhesion molecule-related/down-regulated by oncogenes-like isoform X2 [Montipora foliosa]|uniref:cell adhesion molecule-related/down-regulated by oncogenes-like isoform X2 n=1 Tax=Montipora foliosa TaxID=591990 RepID=UPI0035F11EFE